MTRSSVRSVLAAMLFLPILGDVTSRVSLRADDVFLRGDINDDGRVSIADFHAMTLFTYRGVEPACLEALDVNDDGRVALQDLRDRDRLENFLFHRGPIDERDIPAPYPEPGTDPGEDEIACASYSGKAGEIIDPGAAIEILDSVMPGGDDPTVVIKVRISHSRAIAGFSGVLGNPGGIFDYDGRSLDVGGTNLDWHAGEPRSERNTFFQDDTLVFLHHDDWSLGRNSGNPEQGAMPPATDHLVLKLYACMAPGTQAGTYPLTLEDAEMADFETARSIFPERVSGTLTVEADVAPDADCGGFNTCSFVDPYEPEGPEDVQAQFAIGIADAENGETQTVPVSIFSNVPVEGFTFSIDYDEDEIHCLDVSPVLFSGAEWEHFEFDISEERRHVPNTGWWGGAIAARAVFSSDDPSRFLPPGDLQEVLLLNFAVSEDAEPGFSEIRFRGGALLRGERVRTSVRAFGQDLTQGSVTCFKPYGGSPIGERWSIEFGGIFTSRPDDIEFLRGDVNLDGEVTISDAATLRRALFFENAPPLPCDDAGDVDDGGLLGIGDAIVLLNHVFAGSSGASLIPGPYPEPGLDPTHDALACVDYHVEPAGVSDASVRLGTVEAGPGEEVLVPILISSDIDTEAYQLVVGYDPELFTPAGSPVFDGTVFDEPGGLSGYAKVQPFPERGYFLVGVLASFGPELKIPAGEDVVAGRIRGTVSDSVEPGTEITLRLTEGDANTRAERNELTYVGAARLVSVLPRVEDGVMRIVPDQIFFRGDANFDQEVNVADPVFTLAHLFAGGDQPVCPDAADADDSGRIDMTDAILTLNYLFSGSGSTLAPPHPEKGRDPTPDSDELGPCAVAGSGG